MLVSNEISKNQYVGDGSATEFAYTFPILDSTHIEVYRQLSTETALEAKLVPAEEYTVEGAGVESGGKVIFKTAPSSGTKLSILRNVPITQLYQYQELDSFPAESHENALAKLTMICQGMDERLDRAIVVSPTDTVTPDELRNNIFEASQKAQDSAAAAKDSEMAAAESESNAASSAGAAASSESSASSSAAAAAESERNAANSATAAAESERNAAESESNAANSAAAILELKIEVATLDPGLPAAGEYDPVTGILHLSIPKGDSGASAVATPTSLGGVKPQIGDEDGFELEEDGTQRVRKATAAQRGSVLASETALAGAVPLGGADGSLGEDWLKKAMDAIKENTPATATKDTLGVIKVGSGLAIQVDGTLYVSASTKEITLTESTEDWEVPETAIYTVSCVGGGGNGGRGGNGDRTNHGTGGNGGSAGKVVTASFALNKGDKIPIVVGAATGSSSFGSYITAAGGSNGSAGTTVLGIANGGGGSKGAKGYGTAVTAGTGNSGTGVAMAGKSHGAGGSGGTGYGAGGGGGGGGASSQTGYTSQGGSGGAGARGAVVIQYSSMGE